MRKITTTGILIAIGVFLSVLSGCSKKTTAEVIDWTKTDFKGAELRMLTWEMYADPSFVEPFEKKYNCKVSATFCASSDELAAKLKVGGGSAYDIVCVSGDVGGYLVRLGVLAPIDTAHIPSWQDIPDVFKLDDMVKDGDIYGIPYLWGPDYIIYNTNKIKAPIGSWTELWDPKYQGRIGLHDDVSNIYMMGLILGLNDNDKMGIFNMSDEQLDYSQTELTKLNSNVRKYWSEGGELADLFMNGEIDLAVGWPSTFKDMQTQGLTDLAWCIPEEGCTGWFDRIMIAKDAKNEQLAYLWIDWVTSPEGEALCSISTTFAVSNPRAAEFMNEEQRSVAMVDDTSMFDSINFWNYVERRDVYNDIWTAVKTTK